MIRDLSQHSLNTDFSDATRKLDALEKESTCALLKMA